MNQILFDYHYGMEAEQYAFFRIPKILMTDPIFRKLSLEAKVLYGMMMDRMVLSAKNGWRDETGRIYIYFTIEEICESFNCGKDKAVKALKELEKDIGLIERKKQGQGKPTMIFVKNFTRIIEEDTGDADLDFGNHDERPFGRRMHSLSVSDVVVLHRNGEKKAFYIDD
ncbi:MAG: replication initiator protein A, partial [Bacillota bacterium]|nr:replication initiator protein A [Bacillota bacterium]